jgi:hypothetical protein
MRIKGALALRLGVVFSSAALWVSILIASARSETSTALVPGYFYPVGAGLSAWRQLARDAGSIRIEAILNPANGPGKTKDPTYETVIDEFHKAGGRVLGYVHTAYGKRDLGLVKDDISRHLRFYKVDGFFIDEMASSEQAVPYYTSIFHFIKKSNADLRVVGNPGIAQTQEAYLQAVDTLVVFEGSGTDHAATNPMAAAPWIAKYPPARFAQIVYRVPSAYRMKRALRTARRTHAGSFFITDRGMPNPYDGLPAYWMWEVDAIRAAGD